VSKNCLSCHSKVITIYNFGKVPLVNNFHKSNFVSNKKYLLNLCVCKKCKVLQLQDTPNENKMYSNYKHFSSASEDNLNHLKDLSDFIKNQFSKNSTILEIGCNDGSLLSVLKKKFTNVFGVDPGKNFKRIHEKNKLLTISKHFEKRIIPEIYKKFKNKKFDLIIGLNVFAHFKKVQQAFNLVSNLLSPNGSFIFEVAYAKETIIKYKFDTIYHEHIFNHTLTGLINMIGRTKMNINQASVIKTQGGSLRLICSLNKKRNNSVKKIINNEKMLGFNNIKFYNAIKNKIQYKINIINNFIKKKINVKSKVLLIGAPARGVMFFNTTILKNYKNLTIVDDTNDKILNYFPGSDTKIMSWKSLKNNNSIPKIAILLSWNYKRTMIKKLKTHGFKGSVFIFFPDIKKIKI
jgi:cyclopropane fatty-acyl-phospholipid synthase-like methyltransferase